MYDVSKEFDEFYSDYTVLPREIQSDLREKKKLNLDRLDSGLEEYNEENNTDYYVSDTKEQGSVAMATVTQNDSKDYDIDVAVIFDEDNLVASGVLMEAWSIDDNGDGVCFCVYCYNVQPGITIDYKTGRNWISEQDDDILHHFK